VAGEARAGAAEIGVGAADGPGAEPARAFAPQPAAALRPEPAHGGDLLTLDHDIGDGPVGAKTVKRLRTLGINTVRDLLKADPETLAELIESRHVTAQTIGAWQDQALLMCGVPGLRPAHAQLLEGAGYRSAEAIAAAEAEKLCADLAAFATTPAGQRVLRNGEVPDIERVKTWLEAARRMQAA
jgi:hypothetical protein